MSRFVSGGTNEAPIERDDEWLKAQQEIEARRLQKLDEGKQQDGKSLFEVLQANKAAKQDAFEEKIKLKNQFRSLDDDEVEFLDSVLESTRAKEEAVRKETRDQLNAFRKQQEEAERALAVDEEADKPVAEQEQWASQGRKRKKNQEKQAFIGVKLRRTSSSLEGSEKAKATATQPEHSFKGEPAPKEAAASTTGKAEQSTKSNSPATAISAPDTKRPPPPAGGLGLGGYSSDEED